MFVGDVGSFELVLELAFEDFLEQVLEAAIIPFHDGVLGRQVHRPAAVEAVVEAGAGEVADRIVEIVHCHGNAAGLELEHFEVDLLAALAFPHEAQLAGTGDQRVGGAILVAEGVTADDDGIGPARHQARHVVDHDRFAEDHAAEDVADRAIGRTIHFLQVKLLDACLVRSDRGAFHADAMFLDGIGGIDGDLVVGLVALLDREVVILQIDVEIGQDQPFADPLPDDLRHLVAIDLHDRVLDLNFCHRGFLF